MSAQKQSVKKEKVSVLNSVGTNELTVYGYIGPWQEVDWQPFLDAFRPMDFIGNTVTIHVNCMGGDTFSGLTIFDQLKAAKATIKFITEGVAASMGGVLIQAASKGQRFITPNSRVMIHKVSSWKDGEAEDFAEHGKLLADEDAKLKAIFKAATGQPDKVINKWFTRGAMMWFTAQEALDAGLVDGIVTPEEERVPITGNLLNKTSEEVWGIFNTVQPNKNDTLIKNMNKYKMAILAVLAQAGIATTPTETDTDERWVEALNNAVAAINQKVTDANAALQNVFTERATELINNAEAAGRFNNELTPAVKTQLIADASTPTGYALTKNMIGIVTPVAQGVAAAAPNATDINSLLNNGGKKTAALNNAIPEDRKDWTVTDWAKKDPTGLHNMATSNPQAYQALLNSAEHELIENGAKKTTN